MAETYIITPNFNGEKFLNVYFESLKNQTYRNFKIIIVDNNSKDNSINLIEKYGKSVFKDRLILIKLKNNTGFAKATNIGIMEAFKDNECKYIVCLNNDIKLDKDFLKELIKCAKKYENAAAIQSKMIWWQHPELIDSVGIDYSYNGLAFNRGAYESRDKYNKEEEIFGACAGASLYRREALEDIMIDNEIFDEDFFAYYEDVDLSFRLRWAGWKIYFCPKAICYHYKGGTGGMVSSFNAYYSGRNYTFNLYKNLPFNYIFKRIHLIFFTELIQVLIHLIKGNFALAKARLKSKIDAYLNLRKIINKKRKIKKKVSFKELEKFFIKKWRVKIPKF